MDRLTVEIKAFEKHLEPTKYEADCRERIVREAQQHVTRQLPTAQAYAFGSCETKLLLPNSDVDIAVIASNTEGKSAKFFIRKIQRHLGSVFQVEHLVLKATVPLIKCVDRRSRLGVDITFQANTSSSTRTVKWLKEHPELKPLFLVIKHSLLGIRLELDPNYMALDSSRGGVASFVLICLIVHYLKYNEEAKSFVNPATRLGQLLCGFLQFYAAFDFEKTGLTFSGASGFFDTATDTTFAYRQDTMKHRIIIKSPDEPDQNVARACMTVREFKVVLSWMHGKLKSLIERHELPPSILTHIITVKIPLMSLSNDALSAYVQLGELSAKKKPRNRALSQANSRADKPANDQKRGSKRNWNSAYRGHADKRRRTEYRSK